MDAEVGATDDAEVNPEENGEAQPGVIEPTQGVTRTLLKGHFGLSGSRCRCGSRRLTWIRDGCRTLRHWP
jgi:hypothetical protein